MANIMRLGGMSAEKKSFILVVTKSTGDNNASIDIFTMIFDENITSQYKNFVYTEHSWENDFIKTMYSLPNFSVKAKVPLVKVENGVRTTYQVGDTIASWHYETTNIIDLEFI